MPLRMSLLGAWRETERVSWSFFSASWSIFGTRPQVERLMFRIPMFTPSGGRDVLEKAHDFVEIIQRLPNAHQHDVGDALPDVLLGGVNFGAYLACLEVAHPARLGRGTEAAAHPAAHLVDTQTVLP